MQHLWLRGAALGLSLWLGSLCRLLERKIPDCLPQTSVCFPHPTLASGLGPSGYNAALIGITRIYSYCRFRSRHYWSNSVQIDFSLEYFLHNTNFMAHPVTVTGGVWDAAEGNCCPCSLALTQQHRCCSCTALGLSLCLVHLDVHGAGCASALQY